MANIIASTRKILLPTVIACEYGEKTQKKMNRNRKTTEQKTFYCKVALQKIFEITTGCCYLGSTTALH